jgi:hypothetical protein
MLAMVFDSISHVLSRRQSIVLLAGRRSERLFSTAVTAAAGMAAAADMSTAGMSTAHRGMTHADTPAAAPPATTDPVDASAAAIATATAPAIAAAIIRAPAIVGAVVIPAVIAVAPDHPTQHAGDHAADQRFGNNVATMTMMITNLLDLRVRLYPFRAGCAGQAGQCGRRHEHHSEARYGCNMNTIHRTILSSGENASIMPASQMFERRMPTL